MLPREIIRGHLAPKVNCTPGSIVAGKSPLHSVPKGSFPRYGIDPETGFEEVAGLARASRLVGRYLRADIDSGQRITIS